MEFDIVDLSMEFDIVERRHYYVASMEFDIVDWIWKRAECLGRVLKKFV